MKKFLVRNTVICYVVFGIMLLFAPLGVYVKDFDLSLWFIGAMGSLLIAALFYGGMLYREIK